MGADIKNLRTRIKSVNSTLHLTRAMALVASSKVRRASENMQRGRDYSTALEEMIAQLAASPACRESAYLDNGCAPGSDRIIVIAGDRGLAGGYNNNVYKLMREYPSAEFIPIGKKACERAGKPPVQVEGFSHAQSFELARGLCADFERGAFSRLGVIYTKYVNVMRQDAQIEWLLPLSAEGEQASAGMIFEPDELSVMQAAMPEYIAGCITAAVRESYACEVAARRMAMDSATDNAQVMLEDLRLSYNRARQSAITQEITEIVAGR